MNFQLYISLIFFRRKWQHRKYPKKIHLLHIEKDSQNFSISNFVWEFVTFFSRFEFFEFKFCLVAGVVLSWIVCDFAKRKNEFGTDRITIIIIGCGGVGGVRKVRDKYGALIYVSLIKCRRCCWYNLQKAPKKSDESESLSEPKISSAMIRSSMKPQKSTFWNYMDGLV